MMQSQIGNPSRIAIEPGGHRKIIKGGTRPGREVNVHIQIGTPALGELSVPDLPSDLTRYARASSKIELWRRNGLEIDRSENEHALYGREGVFRL